MAAVEALNFVLQTALVEDTTAAMCCNPSPGCTNTDVRSHYITTEEECVCLLRSNAKSLSLSLSLSLALSLSRFHVPHVHPTFVVAIVETDVGRMIRWFSMLVACLFVIRLVQRITSTHATASCLPGCEYRCMYVRSSGYDVSWQTSPLVCQQVVLTCGLEPSEGCCVGTVPNPLQGGAATVVNTACRNSTLPFNMCRDIDECLSNPCVNVPGSGVSVCTNTPGGYECSCASSAFEYRGELGCVPVAVLATSPPQSATPAPPPPAIVSSEAFASADCDALAPCGPGSGDFPSTFCTGGGRRMIELHCNDGNNYMDYICIPTDGSNETSMVRGGTLAPVEKLLFTILLLYMLYLTFTSSLES